jgi:hypothetical protein
MARDTIFTTDPSRALTGNDLQPRHKSILHLVTERNFLSNDQDFSLARPYSPYPALHQGRKSIATEMYHIDRAKTPDEWERGGRGRRNLPQSEGKLASSVDLSWEGGAVELPRKALSKQAEAMIQGKLQLRSDLPVPQLRVNQVKQDRVGQYMNSHLMKSSMRQRASKPN